MGNPYADGGDYRKDAFRYYGIPFDQNMVVHHIDMNRKNKNMSNLLILPDRLHRQYHLALRRIGGNSDGLCDMKVNSKNIANTEERINAMNDYFQIVKEMEFWLVLKNYYDWKHNIDGK